MTAITCSLAFTDLVDKAWFSIYLLSDPNLIVGSNETLLVQHHNLVNGEIYAAISTEEKSVSRCQAKKS